MQEVAEEPSVQKRNDVVYKFFTANPSLFSNQRYKEQLAGAARFEDLPAGMRLEFQYALSRQGYEVIPEGTGYSPRSSPPSSPKGAPTQEVYPPPPPIDTYPPPPPSDTPEMAPSHGARDVEMTTATGHHAPNTGMAAHSVALAPTPSRPTRERKPPSEFWKGEVQKVVQGGVQKSGGKAVDKKAARAQKPGARVKGSRSS